MSITTSSMTSTCTRCPISTSGIGPDTRLWVESRLTQKAHPEQAYRICLGLLNLSRNYPSERLNASCRIANREGLIRQAKLKLRASVLEIDYTHPRGVKKSQITQLAQSDWLNRRQNLLVTGPCGSGKTYLACALGHNACLNGFNVRYYRLSRLLLALTQSKADGSYQRLPTQLAKIDLLIIDDWGLEPLSPAHRNDLMEIMDDRYGSKPTLMISQLPTDQWYASIGDNMLADAILDRLMHNAHRLNLQGESMRKRKSELT